VRWDGGEYILYIKIHAHTHIYTHVNGDPLKTFKRQGWKEESEKNPYKAAAGSNTAFFG